MKQAVLPGRNIGQGRSDGLKGVVPTDTHFMNDKKGREWRIVISDVQGNGFVMVFLERGAPGIVDEYKFTNLPSLKIPRLVRRQGF